MMIETPRLFLREWSDQDLAAFAALNTDPQVMEYMPHPLSREESDAWVARIREGFKKDSFGLWAIEEKASGAFVGFVGLSRPSFDAPFMPAVEIGWRLARAYWGNGYATEAAIKALELGFERYGLDEIVSFTVPANKRSRRVMERIGMNYQIGGEFDHPKLPEDHPLRRHVLYRIRKSAWEARRG